MFFIYTYHAMPLVFIFKFFQTNTTSCRWNGVGIVCTLSNDNDSYRIISLLFTEEIFAYIHFDSNWWQSRKLNTIKLIFS